MQAAMEVSVKGCQLAHRLTNHPVVCVSMCLLDQASDSTTAKIEEQSAHQPRVPADIMCISFP